MVKILKEAITHTVSDHFLLPASVGKGATSFHIKFADIVQWMLAVMRIMTILSSVADPMQEVPRQQEESVRLTDFFFI